MENSYSDDRQQSTKVFPWQEMDRSVVYEKYGRAIVEVTYGAPFNKNTTFSIKREPSTIVIVALTANKHVILTRQFRPGPNKVIYELPGGYIEKDEEVLDAAERELREETGYNANFRYVGGCHYDAYSTAMKHCVVGTDAQEIAKPEPDEEEQIELVVMPLSEFRQILRRGLLTDVDMGYMALDYLNLMVG